MFELNRLLVICLLLGHLKSYTANRNLENLTEAELLELALAESNAMEIARKAAEERAIQQEIANAESNWLIREAIAQAEEMGRCAGPMPEPTLEERFRGALTFLQDERVFMGAGNEYEQREQFLALTPPQRYYWAPTIPKPYRAQIENYLKQLIANQDYPMLLSLAQIKHTTPEEILSHYYETHDQTFDLPDQVMVAYVLDHPDIVNEPGSTEASIEEVLNSLALEIAAQD